MQSARPTDPGEMEKAHPAGSWKPCLQRRNGGCGCTESALQYKPLQNYIQPYPIPCKQQHMYPEQH